MTEELVTVPGTSIGRRAIIGAAWSLPVIALAVASPAAAASGDIEAGAFTLNGTCGVLGLMGPGFTLTAAETLPISTTIVITGSGVANIGVFSVSGMSASVTVLSSTSRLITLTAPLPAGATGAMRTTLSTTVRFSLFASAALPDGYVSTGAKPSASVNSTQTVCTAS